MAFHYKTVLAQHYTNFTVVPLVIRGTQAKRKLPNGLNIRINLWSDCININMSFNPPSMEQFILGHRITNKPTPCHNRSVNGKSRKIKSTEKYRKWQCVFFIPPPPNTDWEIHPNRWPTVGAVVQGPRSAHSTEAPEFRYAHSICIRTPVNLFGARKLMNINSL